jgi:NB-ARC domain/TIR domain
VDVRDKVFLSYSHKDDRHLKQLLVHLAPLERERHVDLWVDTRIPLGSAWLEEIRNALNSAKVAVLLVTANYLDSAFVWREEMPAILEAQRKDGLKVIWVAASACSYQETYLGELQAANDPGKPMDQLPRPRRLEEWTRVAGKILAGYEADSEVEREGPKKTRNHSWHTHPSSRVCEPPQAPTLFVGRQNDIRTLVRRLTGGSTGSGVVVLTGVAGIGKTALALKVAHHRTIREHFLDGIIWIRVGPHPIVADLLRDLGRFVPDEALFRAPTASASYLALRDLLKEKRILLLLDDVWEKDDVVTLLESRGPACRILLTSRYARISENVPLSPADVITPSPLSEEEGLDLLRQLARSVVSHNTEQCRQLVRDLDFHPLALHVAGRLLRSEETYGWDVTELLTSLRDGSAIIESKAPADRTDLENQITPTVAALLRESTDRLDAVSRHRFASLGMFPRQETFERRMLDAMWGEDAKPTMRKLVDHGLIMPVGADSFRMHPLLAALAVVMLREMS